MLKTRKPTGLAPWPMLLLAGMEKTGKSYACAVFSASSLIDRTLWIEIGEGSADPYGSIPGARYEIVEHDGTYKGILEATKEAVAEPFHGKPNCLVVDSATELWDLLCSEQQGVAMKRGKETITMDQWNVAKKRWRQWLDVLRSHKGPVLLTTRFDQVTVMQGGKPTTEKQWKVRAEKNLSYEVDGTIELPEPRRFFLSGMRSLKFPTPPGGHLPLDPQGGFSLDWFMRELDIQGGSRSYIPLREDPEQPLDVSDMADDKTTEATPIATVEDGEVEPVGPAPSPSTPEAPSQVVEDVLDAELVEVTDELITKPQMKMMRALAQEAALSGPTELHQFASDVIGHPLASSTELTVAEASRVIESLQGLVAQGPMFAGGQA